MSTPAKQFYFDANATTPLSAAAAEVWLETSRKHWHNPSGLYHEAAAAGQLLEDAREELADLFECNEERIVFNSGATEANNAVLAHVLHTLPVSRKIAVSAIEHPCVADAAELLFPAERLVEIPVTPAGSLDLDAFQTTLVREDLGCVSVMAANNETGVLQPWREVAQLCRDRGVPFHCDAAQWIGKLPLEGLASCDYVTASAHKFGGPKGVGFLIVPEGAKDQPGWFRGQIGGPQEGSRRGGTENLPSVIAMLTALKEWRPEMAESGPRDQFEEKLLEQIEGIRILGREAERLWNTSMFVLPAHKNLRWLTRLSSRGVSVSTGSACSSGKDNPSRVMRAMGCPYEEMGRVLRVSSLHRTTHDDWDALLRALVEVEKELKGKSSRAGASGPGKVSLGDL